jgi:hypothetical protein
LLLATTAVPAATPFPEPDHLAAITARVAAGCRSFERSLDRPDPQPSVRQLTSCALGWLELGEAPARAEKLVQHAFGLQIMDPASAAYGNVPWQEGHPEIKDPNAIEFTMQPLGVLLLRHGDKLSAAFKHDAEPHFRAAIAAIHRHNVPVKYSNIYLMKLVNLLTLIDLAPALQGGALTNLASNPWCVVRGGSLLIFHGDHLWYCLSVVATEDP